MPTGKELQDQGNKLFSERDYEKAQEIYKQSREAYNAEGKLDMAAEMQVNLALIDRTMGNYEASAAAMHEPSTRCGASGHITENASVRIVSSPRAAMTWST